MDDLTQPAQAWSAIWEARVAVPYRRMPHSLPSWYGEPYLAFRPLIGRLQRSLARARCVAQTAVATMVLHTTIVVQLQDEKVATTVGG